MLLDKILFSRINALGNSVMKKCGLNKPPRDIDEMNRFLNCLQKMIIHEEFEGLVIADILYNFISGIEVRDRKTTSRTFEDVFGLMFSTVATDIRTRQNPIVPNNIKVYDKFTKGLDWSISGDLSTNKREKADIIIGNYPISLKTLRGVAHDEMDNRMDRRIVVDGETINNTENGEVNVGSFSFRALLKGILTDNDLDTLGDRRKGLGSKSQIRENVLNKIKKYNKIDEFYNRLKDFIEYVYTDDIYIVLKSNYLITWFLIPAKSFQQAILKTYKDDFDHFEDIWNRWENNNLRMMWEPIIDKIVKEHLKLYRIDMLLGKITVNEDLNKFKMAISDFIESELKKYL